MKEKFKTIIYEINPFIYKKIKLDAFKFYNHNLAIFQYEKY
jgi:hypothetical protein